MSTRLPLTLLTFVPLLLIIIWFRSGLILGGGEEGIPFYNPSKTLELVTSVWIEHTTGVFVVSSLSKALIIYLATISSSIGIPPFIFQLFLFYALMTIGVLSVYHITLIFLDQHKSKYLIALIAALFYLFNPFSMSQIWGRSLYVQYFSFALLPFTLLLYILAIKRRKYFYGVLIVLSSALLGTAYGFLTFIIIQWSVLSLYLIYSILLAKDKSQVIRFGISFTIFTFLLWFLINAWWLVPLLSSTTNVYAAGIPSSEENLGTLLGVSRSFTLDVIIRLLHKGYFFDSTAYSPIYSTLPFQLISLLPLCFVLVGLVKTLRSQELVKFRFFAVLLVLGLVVSLGANPPFGWLFVWVFKHITPLQAFRNPFEKFGLVLALGYSMIFAYGLVSFLEGKKLKNLMLVLVLILTCGIYAWPMWSGRVIAGYDKKIGLDIPTYYKELQRWLEDRAGDYKLLMTPIWGGDGAFYQWGDGGRYQGVDPMVFMLDQPTISNSFQAPFYHDFVTSIRKYMERENVVPALSLLRVKFLIDRKDAIKITDREKDQYQFLTSGIYPPQGIESDLKIICSNMTADSKTNDLAWLVCHIPKEDSDLSRIKYLHIKVKTNLPAEIRVALRDIKDVRINWNGRADSDYRTDTEDFQYITLPLGTPTENDSHIDLSKTDILEVWANIQGSLDKSVGGINISEIKLDPGTKKGINEFKKVAEFGNLSVFEPVNFNPPPEFGNLSSISQVKDFPELFKEVNKKRDIIDKEGFILISQNTQKNLKSLPKDPSLQIIDKNKISDSRYWLKVNKAEGQGLLLLSKTFDPQWKVIVGVSREKLSGNFFDDLNLLKAAVLPEDHHFVVNGYANLWKVDSTDTQYAIVFIPQIIADVGSKVSIFSILLMLGFTAIWGLKNLFFSARERSFLNRV